MISRGPSRGDHRGCLLKGKLLFHFNFLTYILVKDDSFFYVRIVCVPFSLLLSFEWHEFGKAAAAAAAFKSIVLRRKIGV